MPTFLLIEGRLLETILKAERGEWRPAAAARNRRPREVRDPARRALRPGCEELAARIRRKCRRREARPPTQNRHGGAPRGERVPLDARRASTSADRRARQRDNGNSAPYRRSARPSSGRMEKRQAKPGRTNAPRERRRLRCLTW